MPMRGRVCQLPRGERRPGGETRCAVAASDTPDGESFRNQFKGLSGELTVKKDGGTVDQLSGATITSRGVTRGVTAALKCVAGMG